MDTIKHEKIEGVYELTTPQNALPLVFDSPHSGQDYPEDFRFTCPVEILKNAEDNDVESFFLNAADYGGSFIHALFPRTYIDVNRAADDIDPDLLAEAWPHDYNPSDRAHAGIGLIRRIVRPGITLYDRKLTVAEIKHRIDTYYMPYHNKLEQLIEDAHYSYGQVWHVNCHSMPAAGRPTGFVRRTVSHSLADFVLGDRNGSSCDLHFTHSMRDFLRGMGYRVDINNPYKGVELVKRHGQPTTGRHSIQLEINKALYWDEQNHCRNRNYDNLKSDLDKLTAFCADYVSNNLNAMAAD